MSVTCAACKHAYADQALFCPNCGRPKARDQARDALVGTLLGERFQVQQLIGQGASGTIYRAEHVTLRRRVAIKVLHAELSRDDLAVERFRREATTVADIDNEHIVEIHDFGRTPDGRLYLAMELLEGESLDHVLAREKQLSIERAADILIQVGEALMEAHAIGYVHRDLRPHNLFLAARRGKQNFVKLLDFGLAKLVETDAQAASTNLGMTFGDPRYMSPEQARGERIDRRADIYQLGCVAYEMLTGAPPFSGDRVFDILTKQVSEAPLPLPSKRPGVPLWLESAVAKMLAKDPANRFATTTRLVEALRRGMETGEVMGDDIARRKESVPPPSVSRVMAKFGVTEDGMPPAIHGTPIGVVPLAGPPEMPAPKPAPTPAPPVVAVAVEPSQPVKRPVADSVELLRKRTGTPKVGVPQVPAADPNVSQGWYDDGENGRAFASQDDDDDDLVPGKRKRKARSSPSASSSELLDELPRDRRWTLWLIAAAILVIGGGAFALSRTGSKKVAETTPPPPAFANTIVIDAPPSAIIEDAGIPTAPVQAVATTKPTSGGRTNSGSKPSTSGSRPSNPTTPTTTTQPTRPGPANPGFGGDFPVLGSDPTPPPPITTNPGTTTVQPPTGTAPADPYAPVTHVDPIVTPVDPNAGSDDGPNVNGNPQDPYGGGGGGGDGGASVGPSASNADSLAARGSQQLAGGDITGAAGSFQAALQADSGNAQARAGMGEIAMKQGNYDDAVTHFRKAVKLAPKSARYHMLLGEALAAAKSFTEASNEFQRSLAIDPNNERAKTGYMHAAARDAGFTD